MKRRDAVKTGIAFGLTVITHDVFEPAAEAADSKTLVVIVMDPLAAPLSCPCVQGYAQRNYKKLASYLERELDRPVKVYFNESLEHALEQKTAGRADVVIGKRSVVAAEATEAKLSLKPVLALSGKEGVTTQTGLIVVPSKDPAQSVADLKNYRIIFGPVECEEKHAAAIELLAKNGVTVSAEPETCASCSDGATTILEAGSQVRAATVISSYAAPLLEGCGTIKKGDLRVVGTTKAVPFVTAFVSEKLAADERAAIEKALLGVAGEPALLLVLESKAGFVAEPAPKAVAKSDEVQKKSR